MQKRAFYKNIFFVYLSLGSVSGILSGIGFTSPYDLFYTPAIAFSIMLIMAQILTMSINFKAISWWIRILISILCIFVGWRLSFMLAFHLYDNLYNITYDWFGLYNHGIVVFMAMFFAGLLGSFFVFIAHYISYPSLEPFIRKSLLIIIATNLISMISFIILETLHWQVYPLHPLSYLASWDDVFMC